jgi:ketosteroid isomerase-like protein
MKKMLAFLTLVAISMCVLGYAQGAEEQGVQKFVESFLLRLGDHQYDTLAADFAPNATVVFTRQREGQWVNTYQTATEWLTGLKKNPNPVTFREPISNVKVTIDSGQLAYLRADFQVVRDGKAQSKGVDQFILVREPTGWKIAMVAYTSMPVNSQ